MKIRELIEEIKAERQRQRAKWGRQRLSLRVWAWVWLEEVGEYCQAKLEQRLAGLEKRNASYWEAQTRKEGIQALTVIWAFFAQWRPWHGIWKI